MKRISLILSLVAVLAIILTFFGAKTAEATTYYDPGCYGGNLYSVITGIPCQQTYNYYPPTNTYIPGCEGGNLYSVVTGQPCNGVGYQNQSGNSTDSYLFVRELAVGSRGEDVTALQQILQSRGYSVGVIDGIYGFRTRLAVMNYQQSRGLSVSGLADWTTLNTLSSNTTSIPPICPMVYPSNCYPYPGTSLTSRISYLAPNYGRVGTAVTVYGSNFASSNNVVNFGSTQISNIHSWNGTSLTFNVPNVPQIYCIQAPCVQNFNVSVVGSNGVASNSVIYTVIQ